MNPPKFTTGLEVLVDKYFGVQHARNDDSHAPASDIFVCRVEGISLNAEVEDEYDATSEEYSRKVTYPDGWQYFLVTPRGQAWGWVSESDLVEHGYTQPEPARAT